MKQVAIIGTGSYLPDNTISNHQLSEMVDTSDEWIYQRTGIKERRITTGESTADLAYNAALKAIEQAGICSQDIDLILCATITPDYAMPSVACVIQERLGATRATAFDLSAACSGFVYGMITAEQFIKTGMYKTVLVIGAETLSKIIDWKDRSTCVLFGDGAGAVLLRESSDKEGMRASCMCSDGSKYSILTCKGIPLWNPFLSANDQDIDNTGCIEATDRVDKELEAIDSVKHGSYITMEGQEVFKYAVRTIVTLIQQVLEKANCTMDSISWIIPHQANQRIIEQAARMLQLPMDKFYLNLEQYGNTSAASIAIALDEVARSGNLKSGDTCILVGFGAGMTSGAILIDV